MEWKIKERPNPYDVERISQSLRVTPLLAILLLQRGIKSIQEAKNFLHPSLSSLTPPQSFPGLEKAGERIKWSIRKKEKVLLYGDYDADGITGLALLYNYYQKMGVEPELYIPHRIEEGFGFHTHVVGKAVRNGVSLIISVDCGTESVEACWEARKRGIDVIVIDHHLRKGELPPAYSLVNPHIYPESPGKELSACGVAFKLLQYLDEEEAYRSLDLVSIGTIADVVPIKGENRTLVKLGLKLLPSTSRKGLNALLDLCGLKGKTLRPWDISYILAPRINAGGRMDHARKALDLLIKDGLEAEEIALSLEMDNRKRRREEEKVLKEVEFMEEDGKIQVYAGKGWHPGVLGIVASRIAERKFCSAFVISLPSDKSFSFGKGSARSRNKVDIFSLLEKSSHLLLSYGGHSRAGGFEILPEKVDEFRKRLKELESEVEEGKLTLEIDAEVPLDNLDLKFFREVSLLSPFGEGNPEPLLLSRNVTLVTPPHYVGGNHLKFWVKGERLHFQVIGLGWAGKLTERIRQGDKVDLVYTPRLENWEGEVREILHLRGLRKIP